MFATPVFPTLADKDVWNARRVPPFSSDSAASAAADAAQPSPNALRPPAFDFAAAPLTNAELAEVYFHRYVDALRRAEEEEASMSDGEERDSVSIARAARVRLAPLHRVPGADPEAERGRMEWLRAYYSTSDPFAAAMADATMAHNNNNNNNNNNSSSDNADGTAGANAGGGGAYGGQSYSSGSSGTGSKRRSSRNPRNIIEAIKHWIFSFRFVTLVTTGLAMVATMSATIYFTYGRQIDSGIKTMATQVTANTLNDDAIKESAVQLSGKILTEPQVQATAIEFISRLSQQKETQVSVDKTYM